MLSESPKYRLRIKTLPAKYQYAILASEIASSLVYRGNREADFGEMLKGHLIRTITDEKSGGKSRFDERAVSNMK
jgi:glutamate dehydrogenase